MLTFCAARMGAKYPYEFGVVHWLEAQDLLVLAFYNRDSTGEISVGKEVARHEDDAGNIHLKVEWLGWREASSGMYDPEAGDFYLDCRPTDTRMNQWGIHARLDPDLDEDG
jgi:hypothetical protein